jgi:hypothetical protein
MLLKESRTAQTATHTECAETDSWLQCMPHDLNGVNIEQGRDCTYNVTEARSLTIVAAETQYHAF